MVGKFCQNIYIPKARVIRQLDAMSTAVSEKLPEDTEKEGAFLFSCGLRVRFTKNVKDLSLPRSCLGVLLVI